MDPRRPSDRNRPCLQSDIQNRTTAFSFYSGLDLTMRYTYGKANLQVLKSWNLPLFFGHSFEKVISLILPIICISLLFIMLFVSTCFHYRKKSTTTSTSPGSFLSIRLRRRSKLRRNRPRLLKRVQETKENADFGLMRGSGVSQPATLDPFAKLLKEWTKLKMWVHVQPQEAVNSCHHLWQNS